MVSAWLIIVTIVVGLVMLAVNIYLFILYCHPDDLSFGAGWFAKIMFMLGSIVSWGFVLILPLDIANSRGTGGGLNIELMYQIFFMLYLAFLVVLLPITLFIYESDDEKPFCSRFCGAIFTEVAVAIIVIVLALIAYGALKTAILCDMLTNRASNLQLSSDIAPSSGNNAPWAATYTLSNAVTYDVPPYIFPIVFLLFIGWFLFVIFGGIGLTALPMDLILDFIYRPRPRPAKEIAERKVALRRRAEELLLFTKTIEERSETYEEDKAEKGFFSRWKTRRNIRSNEGELRKEVYKLDEEFEIYELEATLKANPIWDWFKLILGCLLACVSFVMLLHVIFNVLAYKNGKPLTPFLNTVFIWLEFSVARFISTIFFAFLSLYMLCCVIKGNIKFGLRLFFLIKIHPMKLGRTYMNSFIFNSILVLFCVPPLIHFQTICFQTYMTMTSSAFLFLTIVQNMKFFKWFFQTKFFIYCFVAWAGITLIYLLVRPKSDRMNVKKILERRKKIAEGG